MKKLFALLLAAVMVLGCTSVAMAIKVWTPKPADVESFGYDIEVIKYTRSSNALGSSSFNPNPNATAVNGADVYYAIKLVVPDMKETSAIRQAAKAKVTFTAIDGASTVNSISLKDYPAGVYYFYNRGANKEPDGITDTTATNYFFPISFFQSNGLGMNHMAETPVYAMTCLDTDTAKVYAKVSAERDLTTPFEVDGYRVVATASNVTFTDLSGNNTVVFERNGDGRVTGVQTPGANTDGQFVVKLYSYLDLTAAMISAGQVYMTDANLRTALGFSYVDESQVTWKANSTPIIVDPTVTIPKTGDNSSVLGYLLVMTALVLGVAYKRRKA